MFLFGPFFLRANPIRIGAFFRFYSQTVNKLSLSKLRKLTGHPFTVCKEALLKNDNDVEQAETWLQEESIRRGWDKAGKLAGRLMSYGLLGVLANRSKVLVVEVNCETDFVARNGVFQNFVAIATESVMNHSDIEYRGYWNSDHLKQLEMPNSETLKDTLAVTIGSIGENIRLRRAIGLCLHDPNANQYLAYYSHMSTSGVKQSLRDVRFGKYVSVIRYSSIGEKSPNDKWHEQAGRVGVQLCQHIVGMNPNPSLDPPELPAKDLGEEKFLLWQPFLMNESVRVDELLKTNDIILEDFIRIECGQDKDYYNVDEKNHQVVKI